MRLYYDWGQGPQDEPAPVGSGYVRLLAGDQQVWDGDVTTIVKAWRRWCNGHRGQGRWRVLLESARASVRASGWDTPALEQALERANAVAKQMDVEQSLHLRSLLLAPLLPESHHPLLSPEHEPVLIDYLLTHRHQVASK